MPEVVQPVKDGIISERTDHCECTILPHSASGIPDFAPWTSSIIIDPSIPLFNPVGGGLGSGPATPQSTPAIVEGGNYSILIWDLVNVGFDETAEFTFHLICRTTDGAVFESQFITVQWSSGQVQQSGPFQSARSFAFNLPNCQVSSGGETD